MKASVLPEPVCAAPNISFPCNAKPIVSLCISVGLMYPTFLSPFNVFGDSGKSVNDLIFCWLI